MITYRFSLTMTGPKLENEGLMGWISDLEDHIDPIQYGHDLEEKLKNDSPNGMTYVLEEIEILSRYDALIGKLEVSIFRTESDEELLAEVKRLVRSEEERYPNLPDPE